MQTRRSLSGCEHVGSSPRSTAKRFTLTGNIIDQLVHAFVSSRVDYCNSVFGLIRAKHLHPLQSVLNFAARIISRRSKYDHISDSIRDQLHWLPIVRKTEYKLCRLIFKRLQQSGSKFLSEMCQFVADMTARRNLRSAGSPWRSGRTNGKKHQQLALAVSEFSARKLGPLYRRPYATSRYPWDNSVGVSKPNFL